MLGRIGAILAGLVVFTALEFLASHAASASWPAYALAAPTRAYTLDMLLVRLMAGALAAVASGAVASRVARLDQQASLWFGFVLLLLSVIYHYFIWDQYPVWYHLCWFALIVPFAVLGGKVTSPLRDEQHV